MPFPIKDLNNAYAQYLNQQMQNQFLQHPANAQQNVSPPSPSLCQKKRLQIHKFPRRAISRIERTAMLAVVVWISLVLWRLT